MFSGGSLPKFEKSKSKKPTSVNHSAATSSTAASAVDLVDEDDDHLDKHAKTDGHVRETVYASVAFTAAQPVEIDATAAEAAAASKAATAAHEAAAKAAYTPLEEDDLPKKSGGGMDPTGEAYFATVPVFAVGDWVRVLPVTAPGSLSRLATGFPEARVKAYMSLRQQTKIPRYAVVAVSRDGNEELRTRGGLLSRKGAKAVVQAERSTPINVLGLLEYINMLILNNIATSSYVGHTTDFSRRKQLHKNDCNNPNGEKYNYKVYTTIRDNGGWDNWQVVMIEVFDCKNKLEATKRERECYEELKATMNTKLPYQTQQERKIYVSEKQKEHYHNNLKQIREKNKDYYYHNIEKMREKNKNYYEANKDQIIEDRKEYFKNYLEKKKKR